MKDITGLNGKIENEGVSGKGRLSAEEFNLLVDAAIEMQEKITDYFTPISEDQAVKVIKTLAKAYVSEIKE